MELEILDQNETTFKFGEEEFIFYYREPSTKEKISYMSDLIKKNNGKVSNTNERVFETKFKYGKDILTGFPENNEDGDPQFKFKGKPISSDPESENYNKNWKDLIAKKFFSDIIYFATKIFEGIDVSKMKNDEGAEMLNIEGEVVDDESPLENSSLP